ncbi:serine/threonine protein phosphatase [Martelella alba]|uniref:Serine/threonine protein phosphatase n=1 Tax=Martelella alba TaxID=2590451 RepID=A0A506UAH4_9HYPH|nr:metallophosphoesterase [Martelella alba]TPW28807.1 serine/threonine protein phosphatase [Martelella alba]
MLIAHISDLHISATYDPNGLVRPDAVERARRLVADLAAFRPKIDLVVLTGDNSNDGLAADYDLLKQVLAPLEMPVLPIPGNHDARGPMRSAFPDLPYADETFLHYEWREGPVRIIALDSHVPGEVGGRLCAQRLAWLESRLSLPFEGETLVALHHPPCPTRMGVLDAATLMEGADTLAALMALNDRPVTLLCGHLHRPITCLWKGVNVRAAGSPAFMFDLSVDALNTPDVVDSPYSYAIHFIDGNGGHIIHRHEVDMPVLS